MPFSIGFAPSRLRLTVALGVLALGASSVVVAPGDAMAAAGPNLVLNSTFESGTSGWFVSGTGTLGLGSGHTGSNSARLRSTAGGTVALNDKVNTVTSTVAGTQYTATAWVNISKPGVYVMLRLMEYSSTNAYVAEAQSAQTLKTTGWTKLTVSYTAKKTGSSIDLNVVAHKLPVGVYLDIDDVTMTADDGATPGGWRLVWSDEFNGTKLDTTKWNAENNSTFGDGNNELACLMNRPENLKVSGGMLTITARKEAKAFKCNDKDTRFPNGRQYTAGFVTTRGKVSWEYGRFEMRAKTPTNYGVSKGMWAGFWMRPDASDIGEIDILEQIGTKPGETDWSKSVSQTLWYDYKGTYPREHCAPKVPDGSSSATGFHTYAVEWEKGAVRWYIDGVKTCERTVAQAKWIDTALKGKFHIRLNTSIGGSWPGSPDGTTVFPREYQIDWVRVYQR